MLKDTGYKEKIEMLASWLEEIIDVVKKDLKQEHLKQDRAFCKKYFLGKNPAHLSAAEMVVAYRKDIEEGNVGLGEFIATRWLLKHSEIYGFFETELQNVTSDFEALEELPLPFSEKLMQQSVKLYGAKMTYLFSVLNSVVFPPSIYTQLKGKAEIETETVRVQEENKKQVETLEQLQQKHARELKAQADRYEKKLSGLQKKYLNDVAALKKQISALNRKLQEIPT